MRIILIRHGQTTNNLSQILDTAAPGADLTDKGQEQARALVETLADEPIDSLWVSNLVRTQQTAAPLAAARNLTPIIRPGLREIEAGDWEGMPYSTGSPLYMGTVFTWYDGNNETRMGNGVGREETLARFDDVVREVYEHGGRSAAIVSHGSMLRCWIACRTHGLPLETIRAAGLANTEYSIIEGTPETGFELLVYKNTPVAQYVAPERDAEWGK